MLKLFAFFTLALATLAAQTFESATIRPYVPQDDDAPAPAEPGHMVYRNVTLRLVLAAAHGVRPDQVSGPAWLDTERYDIDAKPPAGAVRDQVPAMLEHLLVERFHMTTHVETRERIGYALVTGNGGPKFTRTKAVTGVDISVAADHVNVTGATVPAFAGLLASYMGKPVADQTAIPGSYDFRLNVSMAELKAGSPSIFTAIQDLGLSLEPRTTSAKYVVVEKAERISAEN